MNANLRAAIYVVALAVIAILVGYGVIHDDQRELWTALVYALLGLAPATALMHLTPDPPKNDVGIAIIDEPPVDLEAPPNIEEHGPTGPLG